MSQSSLALSGGAKMDLDFKPEAFNAQSWKFHQMVCCLLLYLGVKYFHFKSFRQRQPCRYVHSIEGGGVALCGSIESVKKGRRGSGKFVCGIVTLIS